MELTRVIVTFLCLLISGLIFGQERTFKGRVIDGESRQPLIGAQITADHTSATISGRNGEFTIVLTTQSTLLEVSFLGYEKLQLEVSKSNTDLGEIAMNQSPTSLEEILVSASALNFKKNFKGANFKINPLDLKNYNPLNTEEVLKTIPGINVVGDMGLSNRPNISIRGSWGRRSKKILLLEDGSPAAPAPYIAPGAYYNPVSDRVKAIEVYKGADMLKYGPNNMYGAVNYITALPPQKPELRLKLAGGEKGYRTILASYGGTWNGLGTLVEAVYKEFDGFTKNSSVDVLNLNAKIFARLSDNQSLYFKVSGQYEDNQASLAAQTPYTFKTDPMQHPFDADRFTMRRYGLDLIHKWLIDEKTSLTSKIYASDFERDWWRQINTIIKAGDARDYLGQEIFNERYAYLEGNTPGDEDYIRVGSISNGNESTSDSQWLFTVSGLKETLNTNWKAWGGKHQFEGGVKLHQETYKDRFLVNANSRWARSGNIASNRYYYLWSVSGYLRNEFQFNKLTITPIVRMEHIEMYRQDLLQLSQNPDLNSDEEGKLRSVNNVFLPGITVGYQVNKSEFFGSVYRGFIAPSKVFGFFIERNGTLVNPVLGEKLNIEPELSTNLEIGWRGSVLNNRLEGQVTYFNNAITNFIAGGENEIFITPGKTNIMGLEVGFGASLLQPGLNHQLKLNLNATLLKSEVKRGAVQDNDLFGNVVHSVATRNEFIENVNRQRTSYQLYTQDGQGQEVLLTNPVITESDFGNITRAVVTLGKEDVASESPYTPRTTVNFGLDYRYKALSVGLSGTSVGQRYAEYLNFKSESADGAIGELPSFFTMDAYCSYDFLFGKNNKATIFVNGKNIGNNIYKASRLNRAASGIFPGGFRQVIFGVDLSL